VQVAPKMKDPPKCVDEEEQETEDKKPEAKENVQDRKRRNPKLPLHPLPESIGKSPNMDLDLVYTESESDDEILETN
jgi:hypothetical protein